jgi:hypothetical protein
MLLPCSEDPPDDEFWRKEMDLMKENCVSKNIKDDVGWAMAPHDCTVKSSSIPARDTFLMNRRSNLVCQESLAVQGKLCDY